MTSSFWSPSMFLWEVETRTLGGPQGSPKAQMDQTGIPRSPPRAGKVWRGPPIDPQSDEEGPESEPEGEDHRGGDARSQPVAADTRGGQTLRAPEE